MKSVKFYDFVTEENECNENCFFISETVIVYQPVYSFPTT